MQDWRKARTIGIVACSGPGAALCYETITAECGELLGSHHHPEIVLHSFSFGEYYRLLEEGNWPAIANLLTDSCAKLGALGADFAICPDNTVHEAMDHANLEATLPWLHIAEVVARNMSSVPPGSRASARPFCTAFATAMVRAGDSARSHTRPLSPMQISNGTLSPPRAASRLLS